MAFAVAVVFATALLFIFTGPRSGSLSLTFTDEEAGLIECADSVMRVLTVDNPSDSVILRQKCIGFSDGDLMSGLFTRLSELMAATMTDPSQDGVGIAAPQVGILRRVIAVQRFDKDGFPIETYPNLRIVSMSGDPISGPEGCLSIPGYSGEVMRYPEIVISYTDLSSLETVEECISGFTAVIFQHEADHLDGILYTDKVISGSLSASF